MLDRLGAKVLLSRSPRIWSLIQERVTPKYITILLLCIHVYDWYRLRYILVRIKIRQAASLYIVKGGAIHCTARLVLGGHLKSLELVVGENTRTNVRAIEFDWTQFLIAGPVFVIIFRFQVRKIGNVVYDLAIFSLHKYNTVLYS